MTLIFEKSVKGRKGFQAPLSDVPEKGNIPESLRRKNPARLPEVSELDVVRHYTQLSRLNYSVDTNLYPLGSCTMKYNPKFTETAAGLSGFADLHPILAQLPTGEDHVQGALTVLAETETWLAEITGMDALTMQPMAGAHGELTGVMLIAAYHRAKGNKKKYIIVPDSAHGTNPATAAIAGYEIVSIPTDKSGGIDMALLKPKLTKDVAGLMITCPNTLGIFDSNIDQVAKMVHDVDGLMYYDGANLNALLGRCRPGDLGFDVVHINLHKTFATPHGGGGPGAGPVGVKEKLVPYLPAARVKKNSDGKLALKYDYPDSIGYVASFYGNFAVIVKAYAYLLMLGKEGLKETSNHAVLNANYIRQGMKNILPVAFDRICMHEVVLTADELAKKGVHAIDLAKYLIDRGIHSPTVYFPLIVKEAIMVEPTETESKETMDYFLSVMKDALALAEKDPEVFHSFPKTMPISRPDEVRAARELNANYFAAA